MEGLQAGVDVMWDSGNKVSENGPCMTSPISKVKKLFEITNTPRAKKMAVEEPEKCVQIADEEIIDLNLDMSESDDLFTGLELNADSLVFKY